MLLLDTGVFLWTILRLQRIPAATLALIEDRGTSVFVSAASAWEIAIKHALGRLELPGDPALYVPKRIREAGFTVLPISIEHALAVHRLPRHHADPFDRILVAQAQFEGLTIITSDQLIERYDVRTLLI